MPFGEPGILVAALLMPDGGVGFLRSLWGLSEGGA